MALFLFPAVISQTLTTPDNIKLSLTLGSTTMVLLSSAASLTIISLTAATGNVDGMTVCFQNVNNNSFAFSFAHESASEAVVTSRFRNKALGTVGGATGAGSVLYRYNGSVGRWIHLGST